jgi:hypothetical protein
MEVHEEAYSTQDSRTGLFYGIPPADYSIQVKQQHSGIRTVRGTFRALGRKPCRPSARARETFKDGMCPNCTALGDNRELRAWIYKHMEETAALAAGEDTMPHPKCNRAYFTERQTTQAIDELQAERKASERTVQRLRLELHKAKSQPVDVRAALKQLNNGDQVVAICFDLVDKEARGQLKEKHKNALDIIETMTANFGKKPKGRRYSDATKDLHGALAVKYGKSCALFLSENVDGPKERTIGRWLPKHEYQGGYKETLDIALKAVKVYRRLMKKHKLKPGSVAVCLGEDETRIRREPGYCQRTDNVYGFCGRHGWADASDGEDAGEEGSEDGHQCTIDGHCHIGVGGTAGYDRIRDAMTNNETGSYGRVMMFTPLDRRLPAIVVLVATTCNRFTHEYVDRQWKAVSAICNEVLGPVVGRIIGHASDGDARRRKLMTRDMVVERAGPEMMHAGRFLPQGCAGWMCTGKLLDAADMRMGEEDDSSSEWRPVLEARVQKAEAKRKAALSTSASAASRAARYMKRQSVGPNGDSGRRSRDSDSSDSNSNSGESSDGESSDSEGSSGSADDWAERPEAMLREWDVKDIHHQDPIHVAKRLKNLLDSIARLLHFGDGAVATMASLDALRVWGSMPGNEDVDHGLELKNTQQKDRQNWASTQAVLRRKVRHALWQQQSSVGNLQGLILYLDMSWKYTHIFFSRVITFTERIEHACYIIHFLRLWRAWLFLEDGLTVTKNFLTRETFADTVMSCHSAILTILYYAKQLPDSPLHMDRIGTDCVERHFSAQGSWQVNKRDYNYLTMLRHVHNFNWLSEVVTSGAVKAPEARHHNDKLWRLEDKPWACPCFGCAPTHQSALVVGDPAVAGGTEETASAGSKSGCPCHVAECNDPERCKNEVVGSSIDDSTVARIYKDQVHVAVKALALVGVKSSMRRRERTGNRGQRGKTEGDGETLWERWMRALGWLSGEKGADDMGTEGDEVGEGTDNRPGASLVGRYMVVPKAHFALVGGVESVEIL